MLEKKTDYFTVKKTKVMFILAILVFTIHISSLSNYRLDNTLGEKIVRVDRLIASISCVAVPLFLLISGVLFYQNYSYAKTVNKWKSRLFSLVIPYLVWNFTWTVFAFVCSYTPISRFFIGRKKFVLNATNIWGGVFV